MSTSGGTKSPSQWVTVAVQNAELANVGNSPLNIHLPGNADQVIVLQRWAAHFVVSDVTFDFTGDNLCLKDDNGQVLFTPATQDYHAEQWEIDPVAGKVFTVAEPDANLVRLSTVANADPVLTGPILTLAVQAAGAGYAVNDTIRVSGGGANSRARVASIGPLGAVTGLVVQLGGTGYTTLANPHATTNIPPVMGAGIGLTVNVTALNLDGGAMVLALLMARANI